MKILITLSLTVTCAFAGYYEDIYHNISQALSRDPHATWKAKYYEQWANQTEQFFKSLAGTLPYKSVDPALVKDSVDAPLTDTQLQYFDARYYWPYCTSIINHISNQGSCAACWAIATAAVASDRSCITTGAQQFLSYQNIVSCCYGNGCQSGQLSNAFYYWYSNGIPTGGDYESNYGCQPYLIEPNPFGGYTQTPPCSDTCEAGYALSYGSDLHFAYEYYHMNQDEALLQAEIVNNGPIACAMYYHEDFIAYQSGVYQYKWGAYQGIHAVRILGWGVQGSTKYWLGANSWGTSWGENGFFRILRGTNECGIESTCWAGLAFTGSAAAARNECPARSFEHLY